MRDVDMYEMPYHDHDPLLGIAITIAILAIYFAYIWIEDKLNKY
tara:strand:- start:430 stop:561 length:132 start_codon:yes stop_codon:yes gene_type:complete